MKLEEKADVRGDKVYETPELVRHGAVEELTQGTTTGDVFVDCSSHIC